MVKEVGKSIICSLENQGRQWRNVILSPKTWESGGWSCKFWYEPKCPRIRSLDVQGQENMGFSAQAEKVNSPFLHLFLIFRPPKDWMMPTCMDEEGLSSSLSLLIQMLIASRYTLTDTPRSNVTPALWASFSRVRLTHKTNHLTYVRKLCRLKWDYYIRNICDLIFKYPLDFFLCH